MHAHETFEPAPAPHPAGRAIRTATVATLAAALLIAAGVVVLTLAGADTEDITTLRVVTAALTGAGATFGVIALIVGRPR
jgi:hypothetical protein